MWLFMFLAMQCPPGMPQNRMPGQPSMKSEVTGPMWAHPSGGPNARNGSWGEAGPHESSGWDEPKTPTTWNEQQLAPATWGPSSHKPKPMGPTGNWTESEMEAGPSWAHPTKPALTKEVIWNSREFRYLCDLGYKVSYQISKQEKCNFYYEWKIKSWFFDL